MCGIAGILRIGGGKIENQWLNAMAARMTHRGPDGQGIWCDKDERVGFAHRRLAIIDLKTGGQPIANEDESVIVILNGEIYNFLDLRLSLESLGHVFRTKSDTEVLVHAYEEWGSNMLTRLNGMFAFAIYDSHQGKLFLARDRLGVKPLYYYRNKDFFLFASEMGGLTSSSLIPREIDMEALELYFHYQYIPCPFTIYRGVKKLRPAEFAELEISTGQLKFKKYWDIATDLEPNRLKGLMDWMDDLEALINDAVSIRLVSDVPFGAFLSGGTDSGLIVAMMASKLSESVRTFSIGLEGESEDELPYARAIAEQYRTQHEEFRVTPEGLTIVPKLCVHFGEPFADSSAVPTYYISQMASSKVKMVLTGDGGDEIFGGYLTYNALLSVRRFDFLSNEIVRRMAKLIPNGRLRGWLDFIGSSWDQRHDHLMSHFTLEERKKLLGNHLRYSQAEYFARLYQSKWKDMILKTQYLDLKTYLPDDVLVKVDRMSMVNSLEVRSPLLDYRVAEAAFSIPTSLKIPEPTKGGIRGKFILKEIASNYLGKAYVYKPKQGFGIPIGRWLREDRGKYLADTLLSPSSPVYDFVDKPFVEFMAREHQSGRSNQSAKLWNLLMLDGWLRYVYKNLNDVG
jgi:asparagine synthase (glutamine-hydrolysing)